MTRARLLLALLLSLLAAPLPATPASAQDWPARNLRIIVPFPAGGSADMQARVIAEELSRALGQPVIVENRSGAGGNVGAAEAARAAPDGYTLFMATTGTHATNVSLYPTLPYDPVKDFAPLTLVTIYPQVVVPGQKYPQTTLPEFIAALQRAGADASYGSSGIGSPTHLGGEVFKRQTGTRMVHVPYRGQGPALNDLLGGRLDVVFPSIPDVLAFLREGRVRAVATMAAQRSPALPDVPTTAELGYPALVSAIWSGLYARAGTPPAILERLNRELVGIIAAPAFKDRFEAMGFEVRPTSAAEFGAFAAAETRRWGEIIRTQDIHLD